jgi:hypothetical protein
LLLLFLSIAAVAVKKLFMLLLVIPDFFSCIVLTATLV